jgi:hypothetical protein
MATTHTYEAPVGEIARRRRRRGIKQFLIQTLTAAAAVATLGAGWFALYFLISYGWQW